MHNNKTFPTSSSACPNSFLSSSTLSRNFLTSASCVSTLRLVCANSAVFSYSCFFTLEWTWRRSANSYGKSRQTKESLRRWCYSTYCERTFPTVCYVSSEHHVSVQTILKCATLLKASVSNWDLLCSIFWLKTNLGSYKKGPMFDLEEDFSINVTFGSVAPPRF